MLNVLAAEGPNGWFIPGDPNELYWSFASFGILFVIFVWKGVPAISRIMKARTAGIEEELETARSQRAAAEAEAASLTAQLGDAGADAAAIVADARAQAERVEADLVARAEVDVAAAKERARIEIQAQRDQALADLRTAMAAQAQTAADAVVRENLDDAETQRNLIDDYITQVAAG